MRDARTIFPAPAGRADLRDAELIARLQASDTGAQEQLVREHGPQMFAVARRYCRSEEDAADAVQDAFRRASVGSLWSEATSCQERLEPYSSS